MTAVYALKDVSRLLGIQPYQIQHAYITGAVKEPRMRISGRRVYEPIDVQRLAKHFRVTPKADAAVTADAECTTHSTAGTVPAPQATEEK